MKTSILKAKWKWQLCLSIYGKDKTLHRKSHISYSDYYTYRIFLFPKGRAETDDGICRIKKFIQMCKKRDSKAPLPESSPNTRITWRRGWRSFHTWAQTKCSGQAELFHSRNVPTWSATTLTSLSVARKPFCFSSSFSFSFLSLSPGLECTYPEPQWKKVNHSVVIKILPYGGLCQVIAKSEKTKIQLLSCLTGENDTFNIKSELSGGIVGVRERSQAKSHITGPLKNEWVCAK